MKIPNIIHGIWLGSKLPMEFKEYRRIWRRFHPNWDFKLWTEDNIPELENQDLYDNARTYAEKSDIARLEILRDSGGVYADMDISCMKTIRFLIKDAEFFIVCDRPVWKEKDPKYSIPYLNNAFMGCVPGHPFIEMLIRTLPSFVDDNRDEHVCFRTGPGHVSQMLHGLNGVTILDNRMLTRKYAQHHYANSWKKIEPQKRPWPDE